jgi:hypothetical protein
MLARRTDLWRVACAEDGDWFETTRESLYKERVDPKALRHSGEALTAFGQRLSGTPLERLEQGKIA